MSTRQERIDLILNAYSGDLLHLLMRLQRLEDLQRVCRRAIAEGEMGETLFQTMKEASALVDWDPYSDAAI